MLEKELGFPLEEGPGALGLLLLSEPVLKAALLPLVKGVDGDVRIAFGSQPVNDGRVGGAFIDHGVNLELNVFGEFCDFGTTFDHGILDFRFAMICDFRFEK
jgi:hypothetical protein